MILDWREASCEGLKDLHNAFFGPRYAVDTELFEINTVRSPHFDWGVSLVEQDDDGPLLGYVAFKRPAKDLYRVADADALHLADLAFSDPDVGFGLFAEALRRARDRGFAKVVFGADLRHFWPGVPLDAPALNAFLPLQGFEFGGESVDLERDLAGFVYDRPAPGDAELRPLRESDRASATAFFDRTFPGRWKTDALAKVEAEGRWDTLFGLLVGGEVRGFALVQDARAKLPIGGAVWRESLGEGWCALGPIGVDEALRGGGYGGALLGRALESLRDAGGRRCIIDWTGLVEFYGKFGFAPTRHYRAASLALDWASETPEGTSLEP